MARKSLLTEAEIRQFMKLANIQPLQEMGHSMPGMRDDEEDEPGMRDMREADRDDEDEDPPGMRDMREGEEEVEEGMADARGSGHRAPRMSGDRRKREDDKEETIRHRLSIYHKDTKPVLDLYQNQIKLLEVDGSGSVEQVRDRIFSMLPNVA